MLEQKIEALTAAIEKLSATLAGASVSPVVDKPVKAEKPAKVAKAAEPKAEPKSEDSNQSVLVEKAIESMLKANKRKEAIALLDKFGAKSKTGIIEQGAEVMAAFLEGAQDVLLAG